VISAGILSTVSSTENLNFSNTDNCNVTILPGVSSTITIPAGPSNQSDGAATAWIFFYRNGAEAYLIVSVIDGQAEALATIKSGQACSPIFGLFNSVPGNVIDSSAALRAVLPNATAFLSAHPQATEEYALLGGYSFLSAHAPPTWRINYTSCPVDATTAQTGSAFNATVNAITGAAIFEQSRSGIDCRSSSTVTFALPTHSLGAPGMTEVSSELWARPTR
jgi:hypothetical protein